MLHNNTKLIHKERHIAEHSGGTVNPAIHQTSTVLFSSYEDFMSADQGRIAYAYGRAGTPTTFALQSLVAELEGGERSIAFPSGTSAITTTILCFARQGSSILLPDSIYGPTRLFCNNIITKFGVNVVYYDPLIGADISHLIDDSTALIFTESPGSLSFEIQDIPAICEEAKKFGIPVAIDNTWSAGYYFQPFEHGVDISIQSATKYICGYSDTMLGTVTTTKELYPQLFKTFKDQGISVSPHSCYTAARGIRSLVARLETHERNAIEIAKWLKSQKTVSRVLHPALPDHPQHAIWKRDFTGSSGLFSFILDKHYSQDALAAMFNNLELFGMGYSWGGYESLLIPFEINAIRTVTEWKPEGTALRIHVGQEHVEDLINDLETGFKRLTAV